MRSHRLVLSLLSLVLAACNVREVRLAQVPSSVSTDRGQVIYVVRRQWHIAVEFRTDELAAPLASLAPEFTNVRFLSFGFGDLHYLLAKNKKFPGLFAALWPGRGLILVGGRYASPEGIFGSDQVIRVAITGAQSGAAQAFIWGSLSSDAGTVSPYAVAAHDEGLYFSTVHSYSALYTCNTWAAQVLAAAGLPIVTRGVILADQLWSQVRHLPRAPQLIIDKADWNRRNRARLSSSPEEQ
jgi:Protein of unknown function (DUF2459)